MHSLYLSPHHQTFWSSWFNPKISSTDKISSHSFSVQFLCNFSLLKITLNKKKKFFWNWWGWWAGLKRSKEKQPVAKEEVWETMRTISQIKQKKKSRSVEAKYKKMKGCSRLSQNFILHAICSVNWKNITYNTRLNKNSAWANHILEFHSFGSTVHDAL